jgi:hypothetical protein
VADEDAAITALAATPAISPVIVAEDKSAVLAASLAVLIT